MNKSDLIRKMSEKTGSDLKTSGQMVDAFLESVEEALLDGEKVTLIGFGTFEVRERSGRKGKNPRTGEEIEIKPSKTPALKVSKNFKNKFNE